MIRILAHVAVLGFAGALLVMSLLPLVVLHTAPVQRGKPVLFVERVR